LLLTQFLLKKPKKKREKNHLRVISFQSLFMCVWVGVRGGGGWFWVLQNYSMYFFIFGACPTNRHALIYPPHKPIYVAREVDRWLENTPDARRKDIYCFGEKVRCNVSNKLNP
jgi:hypothetical protein